MYNSPTSNAREDMLSATQDKQNPAAAKGKNMAHGSTPKFHNEMGIDKIRIGAKEFQCVGARPPFDHPHIFLDMGDEAEVVCPYCSTLYVYEGTLNHGKSDPETATYEEDTAAA
ncbi:MAG: zinc-finger domain-containing protein [Hyphomicrobiales bacterium]